MSYCEGASGGLERYPGTGCCGTSCAANKTGCSASEPRIRTCVCQENVGCLDRADCGGFRPRGTAATGACPGPCQCAEEEAWNRNVPPKPNCEWLTNFTELRRQWSDHGRRNNCKCCNCRPCRTAAPCRPCITPPPEFSNTSVSRDDYQMYYNERISGGGYSEQMAQNYRSSSQQRFSAGFGPPSDFDSSIPATCPPPPTPKPNMYSGRGSPPLRSSPSECAIHKPWGVCRPPPSQPCQPCAPSPRAIMKKRTCCQCIPGYCMCQPIPRNCNCPAPVQVDARADRECSCDCPSSAECACPPSERRFPRTKVKCQNARLCFPTPRPQPGPKCNCVKCQPCLPPPCEPCTSGKCRTIVPAVKPCYGPDGPSYEESSAASCRPTTPQQPTILPYRGPGAPCEDCRKMSSPPCRPPPTQLYSPGLHTGSRPGSAKLIRHLNRPRSPGSPSTLPPPARFVSPGQSRSRVDLRHNNNEEREQLSSGPEEGGYGLEEGEPDPEYRAPPPTVTPQCHCGPAGSRRCDDKCEYCCALNCDEVLREVKQVFDNLAINPTDNFQCNCSSAISYAHKSDYCCTVGCDEAKAMSQRNNGEIDIELARALCSCGPDGDKCDESCDYCSSKISDAELLDLKDKIDGIAPYESRERLGAGANNSSTETRDDEDRNDDSTSATKPRHALRFADDSNFSENTESTTTVSRFKFGNRWFECPVACTPEVPHLEALSRLAADSENGRQDDESRSKNDLRCCSKLAGVPSVTGRPSSACKLLRSLIRAKSPTKDLNR